MKNDSLSRETEPAASLSDLRSALFRTRRSKTALTNFALGLARDGQYAAAVIWLRRALKSNRNAKPVRAALAEALLHREHWRKGWRFLDAEHNRPELTAPTWDGIRPQKGTLLAYLRPQDPMELILVGLGQVAFLGGRGYPIVCECPSRLLARARRKLRHAEILGRGPKNVATIAARIEKGDITAQIPLAHVAFCSLHGPRSGNNWLSGVEDPASGEIKRLGLIQRSSDDPDAILDPALMSEFKAMIDMPLKTLDPQKNISTFATALDKVDAVLTDDGEAALLAGALGKFVVLALPDRAPWWWGDNPDETALSPNIRLIRTVPGTGARQRTHALSYVLNLGVQPTKHIPPLRPDRGSQRLAECLDRLSPHLKSLDGPRAKLTPLEGGTRNSVFRLSYPGGDQVLRMGKFPLSGTDSKSKEISNMVLAAKAGIAPSLYYSDPLDGTMLSQFIEGESLNIQMMRKKSNALNAAYLFQRLQTLPSFKSTYDIFYHVDNRVEALTGHADEIFLSQGPHNDLMQRIKPILKANEVPPHPTHNDPLSQNFIATPNGLVLIDWECSGMGDPHWEVGSLSSQVGLNDEVRTAYLYEYFGRENHPAACRVCIFEAVCRYFWWMGFILRRYENPGSTSWRRKVDTWQGLLDETLRTKTFKRAMKDAETYRWNPADALPQSF